MSKLTSLIKLKPTIDKYLGKKPTQKQVLMAHSLLLELKNDQIKRYIEIDSMDNMGRINK